MSQAASHDSVLEAATRRRVSWRLMPFLMLNYLLCYIDRVNVGFDSLAAPLIGSGDAPTKVSPDGLEGFAAQGQQQRELVAISGLRKVVEAVSDHAGHLARRCAKSANMD
jgi:hypothetical protein